MPENERVETVITRAESLVDQLESTVRDLINLLREHNKKEDSDE